MPDWCFLDDAEPGLGRPVPAVEQGEYTQFDTNHLGYFRPSRWCRPPGSRISRAAASATGSCWAWSPAACGGIRRCLPGAEFNIDFDGRVDFVTGVNYFNEESGSPRESLINASAPAHSTRLSPARPAGNQRNLRGCDTTPPPCSRREGCARPATSVEKRRPRMGALISANSILERVVNLTLGVREIVRREGVFEYRFSSEISSRRTASRTC